MSEPIQQAVASSTGGFFEARRDFPMHYETRREIAVPAVALFAHLDDHNRLSRHMSQSSWMMAGPRMDIEFDAGKGQVVGSHIHLKGRVLGIVLDVEEVVTEHEAAAPKVWETTGAPKLLVIGPYRMGFEVTPQNTSSLLRILIDYALPGTPLARLAGLALGGFYARWCTQSMAKDAAEFFARSPPPEPSKGATS